MDWMYYYVLDIQNIEMPSGKKDDVGMKYK